MQTNTFKTYLPKLHAYKQNKVIGFFGDQSPLSNFYKTHFTVEVGGTKYDFNTTEQFFMFYKAIKFNDLATAKKILEAKGYPVIYKHLGRQVKKYNDKEWSKARYKVMLFACQHKFEQDKEAQKALLSTGNAILCECSPYDAIWGIKMSEKQNFGYANKWRGQNLLGRVLMEVRSNLQENN